VRTTRINPDFQATRMPIPLRTLIVEDSENDAELLVRTLQRGGYEPASKRVDTAQGMQAALEQSAWDVVISDYSMPSFSGIAALRLLQQHGIDIPFIMLSGVVGEEIAVLAMKAGAHDFVTKGNLARLVPAIERELREAALRREHKRVEHALRVSQEQFLAFMEHSPLASWITDETARLLYVNTGFAQLLGSTPEKITGRNIPEAFPPGLAAVHLANNRRVLDTGEVLEHIESIPRPTGGTGQFLTYRFPLGGHGNERLIGGVALDITERLQSEIALREHAEQMRSLTQRLSEVEESERRNISRELHDCIGPNLVALKLNLHLAQSQLPRELRETIGAQVADAQKVLEATVVHLRNVMADLRPPALDDYGLLAALRTYAEPYSARLGIPVNVLGTDINPRLSLAAETALFRIAQEALNNIAKHARARRVEITVKAAIGHVILLISDDGTGFDPGCPDPQRSSWGLKTMRERAQAIGADLRIESAPGSGTRILVKAARDAA
jgi:two-component system, NarL family, sensor histidine kinase UhpB